jgi:hypothetical protein
MRDESIVVTAELTGKLNHKCFNCEGRHLKKGSIKRCVQSFVKDVFGWPQIDARHRYQNVNFLTAAKMGKLKRAVEYGLLAPSSSFSETWRADWQDFVLCETRQEAYDMAKKRLSEWRDAAFAKYEEAKLVQRRLHEYDDLFYTHGMPIPNHPVNVTSKTVGKVAATNQPGVPFQLVIDGAVTISAGDVADFYQSFYCQDRPGAYHGQVTDADVNRNMYICQVHGYGNTPDSWVLWRFSGRGATDTKLDRAKILPIECY